MIHKMQSTRRVAKGKLLQQCIRWKRSKLGREESRAPCCLTCAQVWRRDEIKFNQRSLGTFTDYRRWAPPGDKSF